MKSKNSFKISQYACAVLLIVSSIALVAYQVVHINDFGYYPYTDTNMTEHTSFLFIADVQYPGGTQPAFVSVAFK